MIVYCITNKINGKKYIGSDSNNNPNYFGSGTYIKKAIKKYGKENFAKTIINKVDNLEGNFIKEWKSLTEASQNLNFSTSTISKSINQNKPTKGFIFKFKL